MFRPIFVFGSNLAGRHGKGAALHAKEVYGAVYGEGRGPTGYAYAIPTKDRDLKTLPLEDIKDYIKEFLDYCYENPGLTFILTPVGTGLAGHSKKDIARLFKECGRLPDNVYLTASWMNDG